MREKDAGLDTFVKIHGGITELNVWFRLVRLVDVLGIKLEVPGENEILSASSLVLAVQMVNGTEFSTTTVNIFNTDDVQVSASQIKETQNHT